MYIRNVGNNYYAYRTRSKWIKEEKDYLIRIEENRRNRKQFDENEVNFGKLYLLSDLNEEPERIYGMYKQREYGIRREVPLLLVPALRSAAKDLVNKSGVWGRILKNIELDPGKIEEAKNLSLKAA